MGWKRSRSISSRRRSGSISRGVQPLHFRCNEAGRLVNDSFETLQLREEPAHVGILTLNRGAVANAINTAMARELLAFFREFPDRHAQLRCLVITGAGTKAFCAGGDLKERSTLSLEE